MSSFHLRPVSDISPSPSPTASTSPPAGRSPHSKGPPVVRPSPALATSGSTRSRRPLSPSSLRDVDLTHAPDMLPRKYAAPLSGHDLMAMFPPAPPDNFPEMRAVPTSGYFQRQERAFFAQAGKEIVRVRVEVDLQNAEPEASTKSRGRDSGALRPWPPLGHTAAPAPHHSPVQAPLLYPHSNSRPAQRGPVPVTAAPLFPMTSHTSSSSSSQLPPNLHPPMLQQQQQQTGVGLRTPPHDHAQSGAPGPKTEFQPAEYDQDEAWRTPMPYADRRRAGKHTKRVVVRN